MKSLFFACGVIKLTPKFVVNERVRLNPKRDNRAPWNMGEGRIASYQNNGWYRVMFGLFEKGFKKMFTLRLTNSCIVSFFMGPTHIYIPNALAGHIVARGTKSLVELVKGAYALAGYETYIEEL